MKKTDNVKKIKFVGDDKFLFGINELSSQLNFTLSNDGCEVQAIKVDGNILTVETTNDKATIYCGCFYNNELIYM